MKVKINQDKYDYLEASLVKDNTVLFNQIKFNFDNGNYFIEGDADILDDIREWAIEKLQVCGFKEDYSLTKEGEMLNDFIDLFFDGNVP